MNGMKNRKVHNSNTPIPGCLGKMVNLFDINPGVTGNKRLMDKPHLNGSSLSRSRSDVARSLNPIEHPLEDKQIISELKRTALNKTPMKLLIDHEMSKEELKYNSPNLVAKLMGLESLPAQKSNSVAYVTQPKNSGFHIMSRSEIPLGYKHTDDCNLTKPMTHVVQYQEETDFKDIYEIWKQSQSKIVNHKYLKKERPTDEKKMALVRQKFVEAKRLVTNEKLRQTKEFQDALEVLSSNPELFLKFLQEPNSPFTQHLFDVYAVPVAAETKRITVLKPSKVEDDKKFSTSENKNEKQTRKSTPVVLSHGRSKSNDERSSPFSYWDSDANPLPTRIVVLKPSIGNTHEMGTFSSPDSSTLETIHGENYFMEIEMCDAQEPREVAKKMTRQMRENLVGLQSDETLLPSVFSNGYTGDESSTNKSDVEYAGESDSEVMSPTSRHSWDYINRFSSPFSSSSFSRVSCSPESSVCREAKKRLSERWAMVALNGNSLEQRHVRRSSSTLGEMLALSDTKKSLPSEEINKKEEARGSTPCTTGDLVTKEEARDSTSCITRELVTDDSLLDSPRNLLRSKSVPVSSSVYGSRPNVELSGPEVGKPAAEPTAQTKSKSSKSSFRGKVSSLFFSRSKKASKSKSNASETKELPLLCTPKKSEPDTGNVTEQCLSRGLQEKHEANASNEVGVSVRSSAKISDNQDQPSPISVLETPFEEDDAAALEFLSAVKQKQGAKAIAQQLKSNLLDKSPLIGSISRTISWKESCSDMVMVHPMTHSVVPLARETEQDWFLSVQALVADSGINDEVQSDTFFRRWHSADSPLDPVLRDSFISLNNKALTHEAHRRQWRSSRKLMYDCVNTALADITRYRPPEAKHSLSSPTSRSSNGHHIPSSLTDTVWTRIKEWLDDYARCAVGNVFDSSNNSLLVESVVKNEVVGKGWAENLRVEVDNVGKEIEEQLLEELVEAAVVALTGRDS